MGSCSLSALIWLRPVTLLFFLIAVLLVQAMTLEIRSTSTLKLEAESVAPQPTVVAPILGKKPKMVSNSTQTENFEPTAEPVLITGLILAVAAACSAILAVVVLVVIIVVAIRCYWDRPSKAPPFGPRYVPSDGDGYVPVYVDRKMAQSAQMFFYQFQKQQILAQESDQKSKHSADSDSCSEAETKDGHMPMVSCPGLAMKSGEDLEVRNPMFFEDVPTWNGSTVTDDEESPNFGTADGTVTSQEGTDVEGTAEQKSTSVTPSAPSPQPPPSTPTSSTPTPSPSEESGPDPKTTDVNKNLTQVLSEAEVKARSTSGEPRS